MNNLINTNKENKRAALKAYYEMLRTAEQQEESLIGSMVEILTETEKPMTAREVSRKMDGAINSRQVAGNLMYFGNWRSRYKTLDRACGKVESGKRYTERRFLEVDSEGNVMADAKPVVRRSYTRAYKITAPKK